MCKEAPTIVRELGGLPALTAFDAGIDPLTVGDHHVAGGDLTVDHTEDLDSVVGRLDAENPLVGSFF
jgi:hypothetical protein